MADKATGEKAMETFELDENIRDLFFYEDAPYDYADRLINQFVYPVRPLV
jgi:hypothetical protein